MTKDLQQLFTSLNREQVIRDGLRDAATEEDAWEIVEAVISFTQANRDAELWNAIAPDIPYALHEDARTHLTLIDDALRHQMEQRLA
jgi:hypothetical protein